MGVVSEMSYVSMDTKNDMLKKSIPQHVHKKAC